MGCTEWILAQSHDNQMGAALFTSGPYIDMAITSSLLMTPQVENGTAVWKVPLGEGAVAHIALEDCSHYVRWLFDKPTRSNGMDLEVATAHMTYVEIATAFSKVTGHPAEARIIDFDTYFNSSPAFAAWASLPSGYNSDLKDPSSLTNRQNFTGFLNIWRSSGGNNGVIQRDYKLLDEIHPQRIKSVEQWFRRQQEIKGDLWEYIQAENIKPVLKIAEKDGRNGKL